MKYYHGTQFTLLLDTVDFLPQVYIPWPPFHYFIVRDFYNKNFSYNLMDS